MSGADPMSASSPQAELIYLACPYSHPEERVQRQRFDLACETAAKMLRAGQLVFSPLSHCVPIADYGLGHDWQYWARHNTEILSRCDRLVVLRAPGWEHSIGVAAEIDLAKQFGIPIEYLDPEPDRRSVTREAS